MDFKLCNDIRCFEPHIYCPKCYAFIHCTNNDESQNKEIQLLGCNSKLCFDKNHRYCPDCNKLIYCPNLNIKSDYSLLRHYESTFENLHYI